MVQNQKTSFPGNKKKVFSRNTYMFLAYLFFLIKKKCFTQNWGKDRYLDGTGFDEISKFAEEYNACCV